MRTLVYKRTHNGDPDAEGRFGIHDCMGQVRAYGYEAVIGVGGVGDEPEECGIARRVNWIGIGPHKAEVGKLARSSRSTTSCSSARTRPSS